MLLYTLLWFKGNAKPLFNFVWSPWMWWLTTGLITNYLGLTAWWYLVKTYKIWGAMAITYCVHTVVEMGLSIWFYGLPDSKQIVGLVLLIIGAFLILK